MLYGTRRPATTEQVCPPKEIRENTKARRAWLAEKLAEVTAAGRVAKIVGAGSYQCISMKIQKDVVMVEQVRGLCQACGGRWAIVGAGISHHGYTRPGTGWQTSSCFGARFAPLSDSCLRTRELAEQLWSAIQSLTDRLADLQSGRVLSLTVTVRGEYLYGLGRRAPDTTVQLVPGDAGFAQALAVKVANTESDLRNTRAHHAEVVARVAAWERGEFNGSTFVEMVPKA